MISEIAYGLFFIFITIGIYLIARILNLRYPHPLTLPILVSAVVLVLFLFILQIPYDTYMIGGQWIDLLLGPAVVALAVPLYKQQKILVKHFLPILSGVLSGSVLGIGSGFLLASLAGFSKEIVYSMIPKSVTTPVAVNIVETTGGIPALTAVFVILAGITGAVLQPTIFNRFKISHFIGRGVGMGTSAHAIGTARSMETAEEEGAVSTVAMILSAIIVSFLVPLFTGFI